MNTQLMCVSCNTTLVNSKGGAVFPCPQCGKHQILRCKNCREIAAKYTCPECSFTGPN
ncbi:RNA-binding protein [Candidatus Woesearchaeota archaeon]|nr:RNA-binding protein [Candidatus Woesearchaeota archaeon]